MRPAVAAALEEIGWVQEEHPAIPEEVEMTAPLYEGAVRRIAVNAYERNSAAREKCILHYGCRCAACGLSLAEKYGEAAQELIHVHHLRQLADVNAEYQVDPVQDLRPVCPTCHAVIHTRTPPFTVEEVAAMIEKTEGNANQVSEVNPPRTVRQAPREKQIPIICRSVGVVRIRVKRRNNRHGGWER